MAWRIVCSVWTICAISAIRRAAASWWARLIGRWDNLLADLRPMQLIRRWWAWRLIPAKDTPFADAPAGSLRDTLWLLAVVQLALPRVLLPATTALATLDQRGREAGLRAGANVLMPNLRRFLCERNMQQQSNFKRRSRRKCGGAVRLASRHWLRSGGGQRNYRDYGRKPCALTQKRGSSMYNPKSLKSRKFINHQEILDTLAYADAHKNVSRPRR